ncbi:MAG: anthranilate phosphoribosyltransferase [SAR324 cluster bacterium]|nr:anthranilate phosphoribosyltransferase [SAR324 cluster bacterium]MED5482953.1 anthranilate phosphoribosyltransferase [SAR324 cluster bacterium]
MSTTLADLLENPEKTMTSIIKRVATGPELSKSISYDEARAGMRLVLDGLADPVQAAVFLIGLRVKRETDDENKGVLQAILDRTKIIEADVDELVDIADPYNGYARSLPSSPFLAALLAESGVPAVSHGIETVAPKFGVTHSQILAAAGVSVNMPVAGIAKQISNPEIGWAYADQSAFCPSLYGLTDFRKRIVKRAAISTAEVLTGPIRGRKKTHLLSGYVHNEYPPIYTMLARHSGFNSTLLLRGTEGGVTPSLRKRGEFVRYWEDSKDTFVEADPTEIGIESENRLVPIPPALLPDKDRDFAPAESNGEIARLSAKEGLDALQGAKSATSDALLFSASLTLWHLERYSSVKEAAVTVRKILSSGKAAERFKRAESCKADV